MDAVRKTRITLRIMAMVFLTIALAVIPPLLIKSSVLGAFFARNDAQNIAQQYAEALRWCHLGAIAALFVPNLIFFIVNEKKGDSGLFLRRRNRLQGWLNFLLIFAGLAAMIGLRFSIDSSNWILLYLSIATLDIAVMLAPYYVFFICAVILWYFYMNAAPATNCALRDPLARKIDNGIKRAVRTR